MGGSTSREVVSNISEQMVAEIIVNISLTCSNNAESIQSISVQCTPPSQPPIPFENSLTCRNCMASILSSQLANYNLQRTSWKYGSVKVNLPIDTDYGNVIQQFISCGTTCKACVFQNLSQSTIIKNVIDCQSTNTITNSIDQKLSNSITQKLTNNTDFLAPLASMLGASSSQQIVANLTSRISTKITSEVIAGVLNTIQNNQVMILTNTGGTSGQTQTSSYNSAVSYLQQTDIFSTIFTDEQYDLLQSLYNDQNTIDSLGNATLRTLNDITNFLKSSVGKVVIFMLIVVGVVFIIGFIMFIVFSIRKKIVQAKTGIR